MRQARQLDEWAVGMQEDVGVAATGVQGLETCFGSDIRWRPAMVPCNSPTFQLHFDVGELALSVTNRASWGLGVNSTERVFLVIFSLIMLGLLLITR